MPSQKQSININFAQGLDTKTDPFQVTVGKFLELKNSIFTKGGLLSKRNGYQGLASLPNTSYEYVTTFNGNLTAIGTSLAAYSQGSETWVNTGAIQPMDVSVLPIVRSNTNQTQCDSVVASNNLVCTVYADFNGSTTTLKYVITDYTTDQVIIPPTIIVPSAGVVINTARVFLLGRHFVIVFGALIAGVNHLQYIAVSTTNPSIAVAATNISSQYTPTTNLSFDGIVNNNFLYLAWNGNDGGGAIRMTKLDFVLTQYSTIIAPGSATTSALVISLAVDTSFPTPNIWVFYAKSGGNSYAFAVNQDLTTVLTTTLVDSNTYFNVACVAANGVLTTYGEKAGAYSYDAAIPTNLIVKNSMTTAGVAGTPSNLVRSVGLASKAFTIANIPYFLAVYGSLFQPTYFLINALTGGVIAKIAYSNGNANLSGSAAFIRTGLPSAMVASDGITVNISYLFKDLIEAVNKSQGLANAAGIYSQSGVNLVSMSLNNKDIVTSEIGKNLNISGGIMWAYDGSVPVEQNFNLWPDYIEVTTATGSGGLIAQQYFYQVIYEWTDAQGNIFRSAPSIPVGIVTTTGSSTNTIFIPTLRITYKTANPVKIVIYRWSAAQQKYFQVTSVSSPLLNNPSVDSVQFVDSQADSAILGNSLIYTNGGVVENIGPPPVSTLTLYKSRLFLVDAEDRNLLWFSKQVIESTPVELNDLFTLFVAPTVSAQGNTGPITALSAMDDKLIIFKKDAIYYITGDGPDNTGINNNFSEPIFITSTVGCANQNSIVFMPNGLMFQSDKGIWLLGRDLNTTYIGAPVEKYNSDLVESALVIPGTNQVRFTLNSGITLMYDYYYQQWATFAGVPSISSTLYQNLHTFINSFGQVLQETPGLYLDGNNPVLLSFTTSWINLAGLQGYQRAYWFYLLGTYLSPIKLNLSIAYDYNEAPIQNTLFTPNNFGPTYGSVSPYGQAQYGGPGKILQERIFLKKERCQSFQITLDEIYDPSFGVAAGAGLTLSGLNLVVALKRGWIPISSAQSTG